MLVFFLRFMRQKNGRQICVQLLQTLNILFENISNETSVCKYLKTVYLYTAVKSCCQWSFLLSLMIITVVVWSSVREAMS